MELCFATQNKGKLKEISLLLKEKYILTGLEEIGCKEELPETQNTLEGNSLQKAQYVWDKFKINCFADDTGLEIEALHGEPGVYSARYAGPGCTPADNIKLVLAKLSGQSNRKARFRTVITLILDGKIQYFEGVVQGKLTETLQGAEGFGYDPIFIPEGESRTFAQMTVEEKNALSHRAKAVRKLVDYLNQLG